MSIVNRITTYQINQNNVSNTIYDLVTIVKISDKPIFDNKKSIEVKYLLLCNFNLNHINIDRSSILGNTTISYKQVKAEEYRGKIEVNVLLGNSGNGKDQYTIARENTIKLLSEIIAQYEKENSKK